MKRYALILLGMISCGSAVAGPVSDSLDITCDQAKAYVDANDGVVLATGSMSSTIHSSYCSGQPAWVKTSDRQYCFVGQYCDCQMTYCPQSHTQGTD